MLDLLKEKNLFTGDTIVKIVASLDRTAIVLIISTWCAAVCMMGLALYTLKIAHDTRLRAETASGLEPHLPTISRSTLAQKELEPYVANLSSRYGDIKFSVINNNVLNATTAEPAHFKDWLSSLSYLDTISPQLRWTIKEFCVGAECGGNMMNTNLSAELIKLVEPKLPEFDSILPEEKKEEGAK